MLTDIRLIIADDHPVFRHGLKQIIQTDARLKVIAEADDGAAALSLIQTHQPEIAILDINMPGLTGFELAQEIKRLKLSTRIILLTMYKDEAMFNAALNLGIQGYVLKDGAIAEIINSIRTVAAGQPYITPLLSGFLLKRGNRAAALEAQQPGLQHLTPTERRILKLIADYKTSKEIADELCIHSRTVDNHRTNISQKLGLHGPHTLVKFALEHKDEL